MALQMNTLRSMLLHVVSTGLSLPLAHFPIDELVHRDLEASEQGGEVRAVILVVYIHDHK